jgi:hypothetical protein
VELPGSPIIAEGSKEDILDTVFRHIQEHGVIITAEPVTPESIHPANPDQKSGAALKIIWRPPFGNRHQRELDTAGSIAIPWRLDPMTYHVVVEQEFFIEEVALGDDLESVLAQIQEFISRYGLTVHVDHVISENDDDQDDIEPVSIEWNPISGLLVAGRN